MASTTTRPMTFAEFEQLPDPREGRYELRHGEPILMPPPKHGHQRIQQLLQRMLSAAVDSAWTAVVEMGFCPAAEHEYRLADVALVNSRRWNTTAADAYFQGAPELVIEVLSPSNTMAEMLDKRAICLQNGAREFWVVDPVRRSVEVSTPDGHSISYSVGKEIPLCCGGTIAVDDIFRES